jgi:hypothetical protein
VVQSIVVLAERALSSGDAQRLVALHDPERPSFRVLVPVGASRNVLVAVLDYLSLLEPREAAEAVEGHPEPTSQQAADDVETSVAMLKELGVEASGEVVDGGDPLTAVEAAVREGAEEVIVVTTPHAVEDTLHTNWASEARKRLGVPVLHVYAGSSWVGP